MTKPIKLGEFLNRVKIPVKIDPNKDYSLVTVKLYHKGVILREKKKGALLGSNMYRVSAGQFILSGIDARNGAFGIVPPELDGAIVTNDFWYFDVDETKVKRDFFFWLTNTPLFLDACIKSSKGETQRIRLQKDLFYDFEFHFPPVEQQEAFLRKFQHSDRILDSLGGEISTQSTYLTQLRQAILQEAIEGKLTAAWRQELPIRTGDYNYDAEALIRKIKATQKSWLTKEKSNGYSEAFVFERKLSKVDEQGVQTLPSPSTWKTVRLIDIVNLIVDCHNKTAPYQNQGIQILRTTNIKNRKITFDDKRFISEKTYKFWSKRCPPEPGDILFTREAPVGEAGIIPPGQKICMGQRLMLIRLFPELIEPRFLLYAITESTFLKRLSLNEKGAFVKHLRVGDVENATLLLPPLAEQHAIVERVDKLLAMVDQLEQQVAERKVQAEELMQAVLREAFG